MSEEAGTPSSEDESFQDCAEVVEQDIATIVELVEDLEVATDFSLQKLHKHFHTCYDSAEELSIAEYILGYREVYKFLTLLGSVFSWVASDVAVKINILEGYNTGDNKHNYQSIKSMLDYEVEKNLINRSKKDDPSGSRTLLRLHRALEYVVAFLAKLDDLSESDKCAPISRMAYEATLQKYHVWPIQKAAKLAMGLLPTKGGLVQKVCKDDSPEARSRVEEDFTKAVASMRKVYLQAQVYYEEKDLVNIP